MKEIEREDIREIIQDIDVEEILGKTFLITGATGAIARYCVLVLMEIAICHGENGCNVIVVCRDRKKGEKIFGEYLKYSQFRMIVGTVEEAIVYEDSIDYILHAACVSATRFFKTNPVDIVSANAVGTYRLLLLAKEKHVRGLLFFSSGAVYGGAVQDDFTYNGIDPLNYENCYALSKQMGENLCVCFAQQYDIPAKVVRIGYTYGPHIDLNDGHLYSDFTKDILLNRDIQIKGDGQNYVGLCYITDAVRAFFKVLFYGVVGTPYVMRNDREYMTIEALAKRLTDEAFAERKLGYKCMKAAPHKALPCVGREPKLLKQLGWEVKVDIVDGFRRVVRYFEEDECREDINE